MESIDDILVLQLAVARLGERELQNWWNVDIGYKLGGAAFLEKISGAQMAVFAIGEGLLGSARLKEEEVVARIPGSSAFSLFCPPSHIRNELMFRYNHCKRYPEDTPDAVRAVLNSETDWTVESLRSFIHNLTGDASSKYEGTSFGRECTGSDGKAFADVGSALRALAFSYLSLEKGQFSLPYYRAHSDV